MSGNPKYLQAFEQELTALLQWAAYRVEIAALDSVIDDLLVDKIGTVSSQQVRQLQAQRTLVPFRVPPSVFVERRAALMQLTPDEMKRLFAPDLFDAQESEVIVWAMRDIVSWLMSQEQSDQLFPHVLAVYQQFLRIATKTYTLVYGKPPTANHATDMVMRLSVARKQFKQP